MAHVASARKLMALTPVTAQSFWEHQFGPVLFNVQKDSSVGLSTSDLADVTFITANTYQTQFIALTEASIEAEFGEFDGPCHCGDSICEEQTLSKLAALWCVSPFAPFARCGWK